MIFQIKFKSSIVYGSLHLTELLKLSKFLPEKYLRIVRASVKRNGYYAHPEHVLLAMVNDDDEVVRQNAWKNIVAARKLPNQRTVQRFEIPEMNYDCNDYKSLIDGRYLVADPPILRDLNVDSENIDFWASKPILKHDIDIDLANMPSHTQSVERCVKLVTEASQAVCGEKKRDGWISNTLASRNIMSQFESEQDYKFSKNVENNLKV